MDIIPWVTIPARARDVCSGDEGEFIPQAGAGGEEGNHPVCGGVVALSLFLVGLEAPLCQEVFSQLLRARALCTRFGQNPSRMDLPWVESLCQAGLTYLFKTSS